jgi:arginase family enzyme
VSRLRARCPDCRTLTAVAFDEGYECHSCGRAFAAGLVRVPAAWGDGGEAMVEAAALQLPYPETAVVDEDRLADQNLALASALPERPLVLGGCCCSHIGAVEGLASRHDRLAVVWFDAHGDLNTPETSPSGNVWGMPFRMLLDSDTIRADDAVLVGARALDPPEEEFIAASGLHTGGEGVTAALAGADAVYVALDVDVLDPDDSVTPFMPEPGGPSVAEVEATLARIRATMPIGGLGLTGVAGVPENVPPLVRFAQAAGL